MLLIAYAADKRWLPPSVTRHPLIYIFSLGVYATSWSFYGSISFAHDNGFLFLATYLGLTIAFILTPILITPILRLVREYQLTSLADLFAFRFRSQAVGIVVTLFTLAGILPFISLQIQTVIESTRILTGEFPSDGTAIGFCILIVLFTALFGTRHISPQEKHEGLIVTIAFQSLIKLIALLMVAGFSVFGIFGGVANLENWLAGHPEVIAEMTKPGQNGPWVSIIILGFAAAFLLPRQFHMMFTENISPKTLQHAAWGLPLFLLVLSLAIPIVLWASIQSNLDTSSDYAVLGIAQKSESTALTLLVFFGGASAASAVVIVSTLAIAGMAINHIVLPAIGTPSTHVSLYRWLLWGRRIIIAVIVFSAYILCQPFEESNKLVNTGLISFVAIAQFLPGIIGTLFWPVANRFGFIAGLIGGGFVWFIVLVLPLLSEFDQTASTSRLPLWNWSGQDQWTFVTLSTLSINSLLFITFSILMRQSPAEKEAAALCAQELTAPYRNRVRLQSPKEFVPALTPTLGPETAKFEVKRAQQDLKIQDEETDTRILSRLRERIERNLSGLVGPQLARDVVNIRLPIDREIRSAETDQLHSMELILETSRRRLRGLAAQLDSMRRYHRQVLEELPIGVCSISLDGEITGWNREMETVSGIPKNTAIGLRPQSLVMPWNQLFGDFIESDHTHVHKKFLALEAGARWFSLSKASIKSVQSDHETSGNELLGTSILVHDITEFHLMENQLAHSERLASIGRFASGVAHEIGNPVTGIACLAQNLEAEISDPKINSEIQDILEQTYRINNIVQTLVNFARRGETEFIQKHRFSITDCLDDAKDLVRIARHGKLIDLIINCAKEIEIAGDRQQISQVLVNVFSNAYDASQTGDVVRVLVSQNVHQIKISIRDFGHGMSDEISERIFEPFMSTKQPGEGTGLGMALTYGIIRDHDGNIEVDSFPGAGTEVRIYLPLP